MSHEPETKEALIEHFGNEEYIQCECCDFETLALRFYNCHEEGVGPHETVKRAFCEICASTTAGSAFSYPSQYRDTGVLLRQASYIGNMIIRECRPRIVEIRPDRQRHVGTVTVIKDE